VCYGNESKHRDLGVPRRALTQHGAVSEPVVRALARHALQRSRAGLSVAISGIAGPGGAVPGKPVGTVWFAFAHRRGQRVSVTSVVKRFRGDRDAVRHKSVVFALRGLYSIAS
jgi:nicotinamide-nucleotide amidase